MSSNTSKRHPCKPSRYSILVTPYFIIHDTRYLVNNIVGSFVILKLIASQDGAKPHQFLHLFHIRKKGEEGWKCNRIRVCSSRVSGRDLCDETSLCKYYRSRIGLAGRPVARVTESCNDSDF